MNTPRIFLLAVAILLMGCTPTVTPSPTAVPTATASATPFPTVNADELGWVEFLSHVSQQQPALDQMAAIQTAAKAGDIAAVTTAASALESIANAEVAWLDAHPPAPCYADAFHLYRSAEQLDADGGRYIATAAASLDTAMLQLGIDSINSASDLIGQTTAALKIVSCS